MIVFHQEFPTVFNLHVDPFPALTYLFKLTNGKAVICLYESSLVYPHVFSLNSFKGVTIRTCPCTSSLHILSLIFSSLSFYCATAY